MKKLDYVASGFLKALQNYKPKQKIYTRNTTLIPSTLNKTFSVHNGVTFLSVTVSEEIIGHKLGEFAQTRRRYYFKKKQKLKKKKK